MADLHDVLLYLVEEYPHKTELSKARTTKMIYLCDWRAAIEEGSQLTDLPWVFNHYGPYLDHVALTAKVTPGLEVVRDSNIYGSPKEVIKRTGPMPPINLSDSDKRIIDEVIEQTKDLYWNDFIRLVYSTYPVATQPRYRELDLVGLAREYSRVRAQL
jgi:hypothetical protein